MICHFRKEIIIRERTYIVSTAFSKIIDSDTWLALIKILSKNCQCTGTVGSDAVTKEAACPYSPATNRTDFIGFPGKQSIGFLNPKAKDILEWSG